MPFTDLVPSQNLQIFSYEDITARIVAEEAERKRKLQSLQLQRERILSERTSSPHRRSALELALATIERELEQLGWSIKI